jgi:hypothetical protein
VLRAPLPAPRDPTPFARLGLVLPGLLALLALILGWWSGRRAALAGREQGAGAPHKDVSKIENKKKS